MRGVPDDAGIGDKYIRNGAEYPAPFSIYCISKFKNSISCIKYFEMLQNVTILCEPLKRIGLQKMKSKNTQKRSENAKNL